MKRVNGTGSAYRLPNGRWRAEWTVGYKDGKRIYRTKSGFKTKKEAYAFLSKENKLNTPDTTVKLLFEEWKKTHYIKITKKTQGCYNAAFNHLGDLQYVKFSQITYADMQSLINGLTLGYQSKLNVKTLLGLLFNFAIKNGLTDRNTAELIELPKRGASTKEAFSQEEIRRLWVSYQLGCQFAGEVLVLIYTGLRINEYMNLKAANIKEGFLIAGNKTEAGKNRVIPLKKQIAEILENGRTESIKVFRKKFSEIKKELEIREELTPHSCRHTYATLLTSAGVQPAVIMKLLGHTKYDMSLHYTHVDIQPLLDAVERI